MRTQMTQILPHSLQRNYLEPPIFIPIVDQAIASLTRRFEQYKEYQKNFGFLFTSNSLQSLDSNNLKSSCDNLEAVLKRDGKSLSAIY